MNPALSGIQRYFGRKGGVKLFVVSGASGGHIFPALAFLQRFKEKYNDADIFILLPEKRLVENFQVDNCRVSYIPMPAIKFKFNLRGIRNILDFIRASLRAMALLLGFGADIVVGFGGLMSIPVVILAWFLRIRTVIHEQNFIPGRANRFLAFFADKIAVSFAGTGGYLKKYRKKIAFTGNPLRKELVKIDKTKARDFFGLDKDKFTVLVMGGSQGSHRINTEFIKALKVIEDKSFLQVIHLSGKSDYAVLRQSYENLKIKFSLFDFFSQMQYAYSASDLIISRSGATTVSEIIFFALPAILIPYPYAYQHQYLNAREAADNGCAFVIKEEDLSADRLKDKLEYFLRNKKESEKMRVLFREFPGQDASGLLVKEVVEF